MPTTLAEPIDALAERGDRTVLVDVRRDDTLDETSARALFERVRGQAAALVDAGVQRGDRVALYARGGAAWVATCLAVVRLGAVAVPLDRQLVGDELAGVLADADPRLVVTDEHSVASLDDVDHGVETRRLDDDSLRASADADLDLPDLDADDDALLFYTSGTTGPPKGVPLAHRHLTFQIDTFEEADLVDAERDRLLVALPPHHVYPLVVGILAPLALGLSVAFPSSLTGSRLVRAVDASDATVLIGVPAIHRAIVDGIERRVSERAVLAWRVLRAAIGASARVRRRLGRRAGRRLFAPLRARVGASLRTLVSGGSRLSPDVADTLEGLGWDVVTGYGLTETAPLITIDPPGSPHRESAGRPLPGLEVRIEPIEEDEDDEDDERDDASRGEVLVRGPGVFDGYRNLDDETAESFTDDGWFRTGDVGRLDDDGFLHLSGRRSTLLVASSGEKIRTEDVEEAYAQHDAVDEIGVLLEDDDSLTAVVVPARGSDENTARDAVAERAETLPSHQRVAHVYVDRRPLERTRLGKLRRHRLEERHAELRDGRADDADAPAVGPMPIDELDPADRRRLADPTVRACWDVLARRFPDEPLTPDTHLELDLGVESLDWLDLGSEIAERTGVEPSEEQLADVETVRDLLDAVAEGEEAGDGRVDPLRDPDGALSERQRRWLEPLSRPADVAARALSHVNRGLMRAAFRLDVDGAERVPTEGPAVLAPNHVSLLDPFVVSAALPEDVRANTSWGGWTGIAFSNVLLRGASRLARVFPIEHGGSVASSLAFGVATLARGRHLAWFPEGSRSTTGELGEFRRGLGDVLDALDDDVPVVPVAILGAHDALPPGRRVPRLRRIAVRFGEPLTPDALAERGDGEDRRERIVDGLRRAVRDLSA